MNRSSTGTSFCCHGSPTCKRLLHGWNANIRPKRNLFGVSTVDKVEPEPAVVCVERTHEMNRCTAGLVSFGSTETKLPNTPARHHSSDFRGEPIYLLCTEMWAKGNVSGAFSYAKMTLLPYGRPRELTPVPAFNPGTNKNL